VQQAGLASLVDNPEKLLHRRTSIQVIDLNLESNTLGFAPPTLGSLSDIELNPFLDHNIAPGQFKLAIPTTILEESFTEHDLEPAQQQANSNSWLPLM